MITETKCVDTFLRTNNSCLPLPTSPSDTNLNHTVNMVNYTEVTLKGCQALCTLVHGPSCSVIYFDVVTRSCMLTQDPQRDAEDPLPNPCILVEKYRKIRCTG